MRVYLGLSWLFCWLAFLGLRCFAQTVNIAGLPFEYLELPVYEFKSPYAQKKILRMGFGQSQIQNAEEWEGLVGASIDQIDLVFSKYQPYDPLVTRLPYSKLMHRRAQALLALDSSLKYKSITWRLVAQTNCSSKQSAFDLFHGFVVYYSLNEDFLEQKISADGYVDQSVIVKYNMSFVHKVVLGRYRIQDSIVFRAFNLHPEWGSRMVVVQDWTSSMYYYGAQILRWQSVNLQDQRIKRIFFFNDGDDFLKHGLPKRKFRLAPGEPPDIPFPGIDKYKVLGNAGGIYEADPSSPEGVLGVMEQVMLNGDGGDVPENNIEALLYALEREPEADVLIMIADNDAAIRDIELLPKVNKPVHVVLCSPQGYPPHPDHVTVAWYTGGSIISRDGEHQFKSPRSMVEGGILKIRRTKYRLLPSNRFEITY